MSTLYVTEFSLLGWSGNREVMAPATNFIQTEYSIAIGGASMQSPPFQSGTNFVLINTDVPCSLAFGDSPVAVTTKHRVSPNDTRFYTVQPGQMLAVIANT